MQACRNDNGGLAKPEKKLKHVKVITCYNSLLRMQLRSHAWNTMLQTYSM